MSKHFLSTDSMNEKIEVLTEFRYKQGHSNRENPDKVIQQKGMDYLEDIERDTAYSSNLNTRIQSVVSKGYKILPHVTQVNGKSKVTARDLEICNFIRYNLNKIPTFETDVIAMFDSISKGFSISEKNYEFINLGKFKNKIGLKDIRFKQAKQFAFIFDKFGHYKLKVVDPYDADPQPLDMSKFIHFIHGRDDENPYGESLASRITFWAWLKKNGAKFWAIFEERFGMPFATVEVPDNAEQDILTKADELLDAVLTDSGAKIPKGLVVKFLEATRTGDASYDGFIRRCNSEITMLVLGQTLSTNESVKGTGTYAQASVHQGVLNNYTLFDVCISATALNNQLIRPLIDMNYSTEHYPKFQWNALNMSMLITIAQNIKNLVDAGLKVPARFIYEAIGIDVPEGDEETLIAAVTPTQNEPKPKGEDNKAKNGFQEHFAEIEDILQQNARFWKENDQISDEYTEKFAKDFHKVAGFIQKQKKFDKEKIENFTTKVLTSDVKELLIISKLQGMDHAQQQMKLSEEFSAEKSNHESHESREKDNLKFGEDPDKKEKSYDEWILYFIGAGIITEVGLKELEKSLTGMTDILARDQAVQLGDKLYNVIASTAGEGYEAVKIAIQEHLTNWGLSELNPSHLATVAQTNLATYYANGREEIYKDADPNEYPYKMVATMNDTRVRDSHRPFHKFTRKINDPIWHVLKIPFDYSCRCTIIVLHRSREATETAVVPDMTQLGFVMNRM